MKKTKKKVNNVITVKLISKAAGFTCRQKRHLPELIQVEVQPDTILSAEKNKRT